MNVRVAVCNQITQIYFYFNLKCILKKLFSVEQVSFIYLLAYFPGDLQRELEVPLFQAAVHNGYSKNVSAFEPLELEESWEDSCLEKNEFHGLDQLSPPPRTQTLPL